MLIATRKVAQAQLEKTRSGFVTRQYGVGQHDQQRHEIRWKDSGNARNPEIATAKLARQIN